MSALMAHSLLQLPEQERDYHADPRDCCRFCRCTEDKPCEIKWREDGHGIFYLARSEQEMTVPTYCSWYVPRVCNAPECVEKLLLEMRSRPILFEASGRRVNG